PGPVFHTIVSIKNDGHYFCRAGGNRPDGLNEPVTVNFPGNWNGGFIRIGAIRMWDDGTGLRIKRGSDPASVSDGTAL
ncbi:hypothetical protein ODQ68_00005, partial [Escherichia coli]|nr:hypothetical protein [Escherichia coli]